MIRITVSKYLPVIEKDGRQIHAVSCNSCPSDWFVSKEFSEAINERVAELNAALKKVTHQWLPSGSDMADE